MSTRLSFPTVKLSVPTVELSLVAGNEFMVGLTFKVVTKLTGILLVGLTECLSVTGLLGLTKSLSVTGSAVELTLAVGLTAMLLVVVRRVWAAVVSA